MNDDTYEAFPCPSCGESDQWIAHYMVPESQGVELTVDTDGKPQEGDYFGDAQASDPEGTDFYECGHCESYVTLDGMVFDRHGTERTGG